MRDLIARARGTLFSLWCRYFRRNLSIGEGLRIYKRLEIIGNGRVVIGNNCIIEGISGDKSQYVSIDTYFPDAIITIGDNVKLSAARISSRYQIIIGNDVLIEESGVIDTDFHSIERGRKKPEDENREKCRVIISNRVCIGSRSFVTKGVIIGEDVIAMPGSIITASVKGGVIVCGNPARPLPDKAHLQS